MLAEIYPPLSPASISYIKLSIRYLLSSNGNISLYTVISVSACWYDYYMNALRSTSTYLSPSWRTQSHS